MSTKFTNNASTLLAEAFPKEARVLMVVRGTGKKFPVTATGDTFNIAVMGTEGRFEIMQCVVRDGDEITVNRAQEGTTALDFAKGALVENRVTAGYLNDVSNDIVNLGTTINNLSITTSGNLEALRQETALNLNNTKIELQNNINNVSASATVGINEAKLAASNAHTAANNAQGTANLAVQKADAAQGTANTAIMRGVVSGGIVMFTGSFGGSDGKRPIARGTSAANENWVLCDGTNGAPNLIDRFIVGAGGSYPINSAGGSTSHSHSLSGTVGSTTLSANNLPSHNHRLGVGNDDGANPKLDGCRWENGWWADACEKTGSSYSHTHSLTGSVMTGASVPPYYALAYIMKL